MSNFHSLDLRERVVDYVLAGNEIKIASTLFQVGRTTIYRWLQLLKTSGDLKPKQPSLGNGYKINHEAISAHFIETPDATLQEVADTFSTHVSTIWYICQKQKITRKKRSRTTKNVMKKGDENL
jgi:transposase